MNFIESSNNTKNSPTADTGIYIVYFVPFSTLKAKKQNRGSILGEVRVQIEASRIHEWSIGDTVLYRIG